MRRVLAAVFITQGLQLYSLHHLLDLVTMLNRPHITLGLQRKQISEITV